MHDRAARVVEGAQVAQPTARRPDPMGEGRVDEERPEDGEDTKVPKRLRSAKAPVMSAGVMAANMSWNEANRMKGMVAA